MIDILIIVGSVIVIMSQFSWRGKTVDGGPSPISTSLREPGYVPSEWRKPMYIPKGDIGPI